MTTNPCVTKFPVQRTIFLGASSMFQAPRTWSGQKKVTNFYRPFFERVHFVIFQFLPSENLEQVRARRNNGKMYVLE